MIPWEQKIRIIRGPLYLRIFDYNILSQQKIYVTCSWHQKDKITNSPDQKFLVLQKKPESLLKPLFNGVSFLIYYFKKCSNPSFFKKKKICSTLNWWIGEFLVLLFWCHEQVDDHIVSQILNQIFEMDGINHIMMDELGQLSLKTIVMELYQICRTKTVFMCLMAKK